MSDPVTKAREALALHDGHTVPGFPSRRVPNYSRVALEEALILAHLNAREAQRSFAPYTERQFNLPEQTPAPAFPSPPAGKEGDDDDTVLARQVTHLFGVIEELQREAVVTRSELSRVTQERDEAVADLIRYADEGGASALRFDALRTAVEEAMALIDAHPINNLDEAYEILTAALDPKGGVAPNEDDVDAKLARGSSPAREPAPVSCEG